MGAPGNSQSVIDGARVLVVDDQPPWAEMVCAVLLAWGAKTSRATSVAEAEALIEAMHFDMVLSDLVMPKEDGFALARWARGHENPAIRRMPLAIMTSETSLVNIKRAQCCGADLVVEKPLKPDVLWLRMSTLLEQARDRPRSQPPCSRVLSEPCPLIPVKAQQVA